MEILNILYSNNLIAVYLIGAILVVILIFIVISSMSTTPKNENTILNDPVEEDNDFKIMPVENQNLEQQLDNKEIPKINELVENLYQKTLDVSIEEQKEPQNLNSFLEEFEVPENIIEEVTNNEIENTNDLVLENESTIVLPEINTQEDATLSSEIETPCLKEEPKENIEDMLKRLYDLRQNESETRKNSLLNEIFELKKQVDEKIKANNNYEINYNHLDTKALADYFLFNEDIEFPKLK